MELRQLRYFVAVSDTLNFRRAAEVLFISPSALSQQVSELEQELGVQLFRRDKRSVELTPAGVLLRKDAVKLLRSAERIVRRGAELTELTDLAVGVDQELVESPAAVCLLADAAHRLALRHPAQRVFYTVRPGPEQKRALGPEDDLTLTMSWMSTLGGGVQSEVLLRSPLYLVYREDGLPPSADRLLAQYPLLMLEREIRSSSHILELTEAMGSAPAFRFLPDYRSIMLHVFSGAGVTALPAFWVNTFSHPAARTLPMPGSPELLLLAAWPSHTPHPTVPEFLEELRAAFRARQTGGPPSPAE